MSRQRRDPDERGLSAAVETALIVPLLVLLVGLLVGTGRAWHTRGIVAGSAAAAARAASLERSGVSADLVARQTAAAGLRDVRCLATDIHIDTSGFATPVGTPAVVTVTVSCRVGMGDVLVPGWPETIELSASATSSLDRFRERQP